MAPFNTHFLIAEKIWPQLDGPWQAYYGQFCFGCVAPDVDKLSTTLTQKDTHFFDRSGTYMLMASHRSATFIARQAEFLRRPFNKLDPESQAFVLGYLCHLCVDEVSKYLWGYEVWQHFADVGPSPAFAALDEVARQHTQNYAVIAEVLDEVEIIDIIPHIPHRDLEAMLRGARAFARAETVENEYLALVDMFSNPAPDQRQQKLQNLLEKIDVARSRVHVFELETVVLAALRHSRQRLADLREGRLPEPGYPIIEPTPLP